MATVTCIFLLLFAGFLLTAIWFLKLVGMIPDLSMAFSCSISSIVLAWEMACWKSTGSWYVCQEGQALTKRITLIASMSSLVGWARSALCCSWLAPLLAVKTPLSSCSPGTKVFALSADFLSFLPLYNFWASCLSCNMLKINKSVPRSKLPTMISPCLWLFWSPKRGDSVYGRWCKDGNASKRPLGCGANLKAEKARIL